VALASKGPFWSLSRGLPDLYDELKLAKYKEIHE
jgi:hypothetical protein